MRLEIALCQLRPLFGNPEGNARTISDLTASDEADVLVFPECFLTGYGTDSAELGARVEEAVGCLERVCAENGKAIAVGTPLVTDRGITNSLLFITPERTVVYDKTHLARFGIYSEDGYMPGDGPAVAEYRGMTFGLSICYDVFFPEVLHCCSLMGSDVNLCVSASAVQSMPYFDRILPARALEDVTYLAFVNNTGTIDGLDMAGMSRALDPLGETVLKMDAEPEISRFVADTEVLAESRRVRHHLDDFRSDIEWDRWLQARSHCQTL